MENITLGWLTNNLGFLITLVGMFVTIYLAIKKAFNKGLDPINTKIEKIEHGFNLQFKGVEEQLKKMQKDLKNDIKESDLNATKNFLVARLEEFEHVKSSKEIDETTLQRFWEEYQRYEKMGGNSYIKAKVERLKKNGIL